MIFPSHKTADVFVVSTDVATHHLFSVPSRCSQLQQKRTYRAVLEAKRELLVQGVSDAPLPALVNVQMELRKCCDHPFLISGVEESMTRGMDATEAAAAMVDASGKLVPLAPAPPASTVRLDYFATWSLGAAR